VVVVRAGRGGCEGVTLGEAIKRAQDIQAINPDWLLCGSAALILTGVIPPRDINDLDFATNEVPLILDKGKEYVWKQGEYTHYKIPDGCVFSHTKPVRRGPHTWGIYLQHLGDIIMWKASYDRDKDRKDLAVIKTSIKAK
jgi:hypothetical protein